MTQEKANAYVQRWTRNLPYHKFPPLPDVKIKNSGQCR